jgi:hypothetical protein
VVAIVGLHHKGASALHAPSRKPDWDDTHLRGRALTQLHPYHQCGKSDHQGNDHIYELAANAASSEDGKYIMLCYALALINEQIPYSTTVGKLTEMMLSRWDELQVMRTMSLDPPPGRRTPMRFEGVGHQFVDDVAISGFKLELMASLDVHELIEYSERHGIPRQYLDFSDLPVDVLTSHREILDANNAWWTTVQRVHRIFSNVFKKGITAPALRIILGAYQIPSDEGLHPADAWLFLEHVFPGRFRTDSEAIVFVRGMI